MKDELTIAIESIHTQNRWFMAIFASILVGVIITVTTIGTNQRSISSQVTKINDDYAPLMIIQDIAKDNSNLIKILQMLPQTTKDDPRYINAVNESQLFQTEALRRASGSKRGGGGSGSVMGGVK